MSLRVHVNGCLFPHRTIKFSAGEVQPRLIEKVGRGRGANALIEADLFSADDVMELLVMTDAVREECGPNTPIHLICKYFPYARQDRVCARGEGLGARVMAKLINAQGYAAVEVWDAHSNVVPALLDRCTNVHCKEFVVRIASQFNALVSPDTGAYAKVRDCCVLTGVPMVEGLKHRDPETGDISGADVNRSTLGMISSLARPRLLIVDDICDGGRSFTELAKVLKEVLIEPEIFLYVTHGIMSKGLGPFKGLIEGIYCANPFPDVLLCIRNPYDGDPRPGEVGFEIVTRFA